MAHPFGAWIFAVVVVLALAAAEPSSAAPIPGGAGVAASAGRFLHNWSDRAELIQSEQPHWITPVATVTPLLKQELRYDQTFASGPGGFALDDFGSGKGLELIPWQNVELILGIPPYLGRNRPRGSDGFGDWSALVKYRIVSAPAREGAYVVSFFAGIKVPTAAGRNSLGHTILTPTIAFGKGWGRFVVQSTVGASLPSGGEDRLGVPLRYNTTFQYRLLRRVWPEIELNYAWWASGGRRGENELFLTPGIVIGHIPIHGRVGVTFGSGVQIALTKHREANTRWILTFRVPF